MIRGSDVTNKTLSEIIDEIRNGGKPDYEDMKYAVCALDALLTFDRMALSNLAEAEQNGKKPILTRSAKWQYKEYFNRTKRALEKPPKEWVGWNNDPENPEFQSRRKLANKIYCKNFCE